MPAVFAGLDMTAHGSGAAVLAKGRAIPAEAMEGQTFSGKQAAAQGLVTGLADSFGDALRSF